MRLLKFGNNGELCFAEYLIGDSPKYAVLSHTWGADEEEVAFKDIKDGLGRDKAGYAKIQFCGEQARRDGLLYFWVDTCCIDKANQAELTEAINSMFRWYHQSAKCYVYLADVATGKRDRDQRDLLWKLAFRNSRWFTRGWTLQELLAPKHVVFYSREWKLLGNKHKLQQEIHEATHIPLEAILGTTLTAFSPNERMRWAANRNTKKPEDKYYSLLGIFDVYMPLVYGEGENALVRLKEEIGKSFLRDLDKMMQTTCVLDSHQSLTGGNGVSPVTQNTVFLNNHRKALLDSMSFDSMDSRRTTIKNAYSTTCTWLLTHPAYVEWTKSNNFSQHRGFLWIDGKPGVGKSTLLKFAYANAEKDKTECEILLSYFFNARGDELERSTTGMFRALLFQLFNAVPDLQIVLDELPRSYSHHKQHSMWTVDMLYKLFTSVVAKLKQRRVKCFIDALDECDEQQIQEMIVFFEELGQYALDNETQLFICFTSRHYPTIGIRCGRQLTLEDEHGHVQDLAKYIQNHLRVGIGKQVEQIKVQIQEKANSVFMWAVLVIPILNKEFRNGRIFAVQKRLQEIPAELGKLFTHILKRDTDNMSEFLLCLQLILFARKPLKREQFYYAMVAGIDPASDNVREWDPETVTLKQMDSFVLSSSKGLAELTRSSTPTVQFIHESVRDFLIEGDGLYEVWPELKEQLHSQSHDQLKQCCLSYLLVNLSRCVSSNENLPCASSDITRYHQTTWALRTNLITKLPFLEYATEHVLHHADEAARSSPQDNFLVEFPFDAWIKVSNMLDGHRTDRYAPDSTLLYVLAEKNLVRLIQTIRRHSSELDVRGGRHYYPLFVALANGHRDAAQALLQHDTGHPPGNTSVGLGLYYESPARADQTPLLWALENEHQALAEILVNVPGLNLQRRNRHGRSALFLAVEKGYVDVIRRIFDLSSQCIADKDRESHIALMKRNEAERHNIIGLLFGQKADSGSQALTNGSSRALFAASASGDTLLVQILLAAGADVNAKANTYGSNALWVASKRGHDHVVNILLTAGADIEAPETYREALCAASESGHEQIVRVLLTAGVDTKAPKAYMKALCAASEGGHGQIVQMLLAAIADGKAPTAYEKALCAIAWNGNEQAMRILVAAEAGASSQEGSRAKDSALHIASAQGCTGVLQTLLNAGANVNAPGPQGTALYVASEKGNEQVVQILIAAGADLTAHEGSHGNNALYIASECGHEQVVRKLLEAELDLSAEVLYDALRVASGHGFEKIVQLLLAKGAQVNRTEVKGDSPLLLASEGGYERVVQMLLSAGADVNTCSGTTGRTALYGASVRGHELVVRTLLGAGAAVDARGLDDTTLQLASVRGHEDVVQMLVVAKKAAPQ